MDKHKDLGDKLRGEAIKGTIEPEVKKEPNHAIFIDQSGSLWDPTEDERIPEGEKRALDGNR
jgi:hypothetical protein